MRISFLVMLFFLFAGESDRLNESDCIWVVLVLLGLYIGFPLFFMKLGLSYVVLLLIGETISSKNYIHLLFLKS